MRLSDIIDRCGYFFMDNFEKSYQIATTALVSFGAGEYIASSSSTNPAGLTHVVEGVLIYSIFEFMQKGIIQPTLNQTERINSRGMSI